MSSYVGPQYYGISYPDGAKVIMYAHPKAAQMIGLVNKNEYINYIPDMPVVDLVKLESIIERNGLDKNLTIENVFEHLNIKTSEEDFAVVFFRYKKFWTGLQEAKELSEGLSRLSNDCIIS